MHRKTSKHRKRARLAFVYSLMAVSIIAGVVILILIVQGYRFNRFHGTVEQGGLVQFDSKPSGATVSVDDIQLAARTASKLTISAGSHRVTMARDGYLPWSKTVTVKAGGVLWLNYARLYPEDPTITTTATYDTVGSALVSPSRKQLVTVGTVSQSTLYVTPLNDDKPATRAVSIEAAEMTTPTDTASAVFSLVSWDQDGRYVIVKHAYDDKTEYLSVDTTSGNATNITKALGVAASRLEYVLGDHNALYMLTDAHELRRADLSAATLSGPLLSNIADFAQADRSTVTYETRLDDQGSRSVGYLTNGASRPRAVHTVKDDGTASFKFRMGTYYNDHYLVVAYGDTTTIYTADVPSSDASATLSWRRVGWLSTTGGVRYLGFSPNSSRFVYAQMTNTALTYDLETDVLAKTTFQGNLSREIDWVDTFHIGATAADSVFFYDFDGTNGRSVAAGIIDAPVTISENDKYFYYFAPHDTKSVLKRVQLVNS